MRPYGCVPNSYRALKAYKEKRARHDVFFAVKVDDEHALRQHLEQGMDVNERNDEGATLLHQTGVWGASKCAEMLLTRGANTRVVTPENRWTPLHSACYTGHIGTILQFYRHSPDTFHSELVGDVCIPPAPQPDIVADSSNADRQLAIPDYDGMYPLDTLISLRKRYFDQVKLERRRILETLRKGNELVEDKHTQAFLRKRFEKDTDYSTFSVLTGSSAIKSSVLFDDVESLDDTTESDSDNGNEKMLQRNSSGRQGHSDVRWSTEMLSWGKNNLQLGYTPTGQTNYQEQPHVVRELSNTIKVVAVSAGPCHSLLLTSQGEVYSWGAGRRGRLGLGDEEPRIHPTKISCFGPQTGQIVYKASAGESHSLAVTNSGILWAWGCHKYGQLGLGLIPNSKETMVTAPTRVEGAFWRDGRSKKYVRSISAGYAHSVAITSDGVAWSWGSNKFGQLGLSTTSIEEQSGSKKRCGRQICSRPTQVVSLTSSAGNPGKKQRRLVKAVAGPQSTIFLSDLGLLWQCGYGNSSPTLLKFTEEGCVDDILGECFADERKMPLNRQEAKDAVVTSQKSYPTHRKTTGNRPQGGGGSARSRSGSRSRSHSDTSEPTSGTPENSVDRSRLGSVSSQPNAVAEIDEGSEMDFYSGSSASTPTVGIPTALRPRDYPHPHISFTYPKEDVRRKRGISYLSSQRNRSQSAFIKDIAVGKYQGMALDQWGGVWTWGTGTDLLGHNYRVSTFEPRKLTFFSRCNIQIVSIAAGSDHCVAVSDKGDVYSWGKSCLGTSSRYEKLPKRIPCLTNVLSVSSSGESVLAICGYLHPLTPSREAAPSLKGLCEERIIGDIDMHNVCNRFFNGYLCNSFMLCNYAAEWLMYNLPAMLVQGSHKDLQLLSTAGYALSTGNYQYHPPDYAKEVLLEKLHTMWIKKHKQVDRMVDKVYPICLMIQQADVLKGSVQYKLLDEMLEAGAHRLSLSDSSFSDLLQEDHKSAISSIQALVRDSQLLTSVNTLVIYVVSKMPNPLRSFDGIGKVFVNKIDDFFRTSFEALRVHDTEGHCILNSFRKRTLHVYQNLRKILKVTKFLKKKLAQTLLSTESFIADLCKSNESPNGHMLQSFQRRLYDLLDTAIRVRPVATLALFVATWSSYFYNDLGISSDDVNYIRQSAQAVWHFYQLAPEEHAIAISDESAHELLHHFQTRECEEFVRTLERCIPFYQLVSAHSVHRIFSQPVACTMSPTSPGSPSSPVCNEELGPDKDKSEERPSPHPYILPSPKKNSKSKPVKIKLSDFLSPPQQVVEQQNVTTSPKTNPWGNKPDKNRQEKSPSLRSLREASKEQEGLQPKPISLPKSYATTTNLDRHRKQNYLAAAATPNEKPSLRSIQQGLLEKREEIAAIHHSVGSKAKHAGNVDGNAKTVWGFMDKEGIKPLSAIQQEEARKKQEAEQQRLQQEEEALVEAAIQASMRENNPENVASDHEPPQKGRGGKCGHRGRGQPRGRGSRGRGGGRGKKHGKNPSTVL